MNDVKLFGRLTKEGDVRNTQDGSVLVRTSIAVDTYTKKDGKTADFINLVMFGKTAERFNKTYGARSDKGKGQQILITSGRIKTGSYVNNAGVKIYTFDVVVNDFEIACPKEPGAGGGSAPSAFDAPAYGGASPAGSPAPPADADGFLQIPDGIDEELPFN